MTIILQFGRLRPVRLLSRLETDVRYRNFAEDANQLLSQVVHLVPQLETPQFQNYPLHSPIEAGDTPGHDDYYGEGTQ